MLARLEGLVPHPDLGEQPLQVETGQDDADRARHRGRVRDDPVRGAGDVVATRGGEVAERRHHRHLPLLLEAHDLAIDVVARGDPAARAVHAQHDRLHPLVVRGLLELGVDALDRALLLEEAEGVLRRQVGDDVRDVDEEDLRATLALERRLAQRPLAAQESEVAERDEAAARAERQRDEQEPGPHRDPPARPPRASWCRSRRRAISSLGMTFSSSRTWRIGRSRATAFLKSSAARS